MDGADILLMRDERAAIAYAWDSASRVGEIGPEADMPPDPAAEEAPSGEEIRRLRTILADMRNDNVAEIGFSRYAQDEPLDALSP